MEIPENLKRRLLSELDFVIHKVSEESETTRKLYFLSAAYGAIERTMRFHLDNELLIAHAVLNICYSALLDRINRIKDGDVAVQVPRDWSEQIIEYLSELRSLIEKNQSTYTALEKIMRLAYSTSGPGYYTISYLESLKSG